MKANEENILDKIIKACSDNENIRYEDIPEMSLITAFWIMRIQKDYYTAYAKKQSPNINKSLINHAIKTAQKAVYMHFADIFSNDFNHYIDSLIDDLYSQDEHLSSDLDNLCKHHDVPSSLLHHLKKLLNDLQSLKYDIESYAIDIQNINSIIQKDEQHETSLDIPSISTPSDIQKSFLVYFESTLPIERLKSFSPSNQLKLSNQPISRYFPWSYNHPERWQSHIESIVKLHEKLNAIRSYITTNIFTISDDIFHSILSSSNEDNIIYNFLNNIRYPKHIYFNLESLLIFLFLEEKFDYNPTFDFLIRKYENFFTNIYLKLYKKSQYIDQILFPESSVQKDEICKIYVSPPNFSMRLDNRLSIFTLKKLISLYLFYFDICPNNNPNLDLCKYFYKILDLTMLPYMSYHPLLTDLPTYFMEKYNITQKQLAKILHVAEKTISEQKKNKTLLSKHRLFWLAAEGCTYEYLNGETTIPDYGKSTQERNNLYLINIASCTAHSEIFFKTINNLYEYKNQVDTSNKTKKQLLSDKYLAPISEKALELNENMFQCRSSIRRIKEKLYTAILLEKTSGTSSKDTKTLEKKSHLVYNSFLELLDRINMLLKEWNININSHN